MKKYKARKYLPNSGDPHGVLLQVDPQNLTIYDDGEQEILNLADFDLELSGIEGDRIRMSHRPTGTVFLTSDPNLVKELEKNGGIHTVEQRATYIHKKLRILPYKRVAYIGTICGVVLGIPLIFYLTFDVWVNMAVNNIPASVEESIGKAYIADSKTKYDKKSALWKRVDTIGQRLVKHLDKNPYKFHFLIENKNELNAYALPGGTICVLSKIVKEAKSDDEIAGVLGHEIGHVKNRDTLRHMLHSGGLGLVLSLIFGGEDKNQQIQQIIPLLTALESLNYSRAQESSADETAILLTLKSGYDPEALIELFKRFAKDEPKYGKAVYSIMSDHPMSDSRIEMIRHDSEIMRKKLKDEGLLAPKAEPVKITDTASNTTKSKDLGDKDKDKDDDDKDKDDEDNNKDDDDSKKENLHRHRILFWEF